MVLLMFITLNNFLVFHKSPPTWGPDLRRLLRGWVWCKECSGKGRSSEKTQHSKLEANSLWCEFGFKAVNQHCKQKQMLEDRWLPDPQGRSATAHSLVQELFLGLVSASTNFCTPTWCQSLGKPHTGTVQVPLGLARAGREGGEPHGPVPRLCLPVRAAPACPRLGHEEFCCMSHMQE